MRFLSFIFALLFSFLLAAQDIVKYQLKPSENISEVLNDLGACPLWGAEGKVAKVLKLNPEINPRNIKEGDVLKVPLSFFTRVNDIHFLNDSFVAPKSEGNNLCALKKRAKKKKVVAIKPKPKAKAPKIKPISVSNEPLKIQSVEIYSDKEMMEKNLIDFIVNFNKKVYTQGSPRLKIQAKGNLGYASYYAGEKTKQLKFRYHHSFDVKKVKLIKVFIPRNNKDFHVKDERGKFVYLENRLFEIPSDLSDTKSPEIVGINPRELKIFTPKEQILIDVEFDEDIVVIGKPSLSLKFDNKQARAEIIRDKSSKTLTFGYFVEKGDAAENGVEVVGELNLGGAKITDSYGNAFENNHTGRFFRNLKIPKNLTKVANVVLPASRTYFDKETLEFKLIYNNPIKVSGAPKLKIKIGQDTKEIPASRVKENTLAFVYTVGKGDFDDDGITVYPELVLDGSASIADSLGLEVGGSFYFYEDSGIKINSGRGSIVKVSAPSRQFVKKGDTISIVIEFDKEVAVVEKPWIVAEVAGKDRKFVYSGGEKTKKMVFKYKVKNEDHGKGMLIQAPIVVAKEGQISNLNGNIPNLYFNEINLPHFEVDTRKPKITSVNYPRDEKFIYGDNIQFIVHYSEPVNVTGKPRIRLSLTSGEVFAEYSKGNGSRELTFDYIVHPTDKDQLGVTLAPPIELSNSSIVDKAGNPAQTEFGEVHMKTSSVDGTVGYELATSGRGYDKRARAGLKGVNNYFSNFSFDAEFSNIRIESRDLEDDTTANLTSSLTTGLYGTLSTRWSPLWISDIKLGAKKVEFEEASNFTIEKLSNDYFTLELSARYLFRDTMGMFFTLGLEQRPYIHARGTKILLIDPLSVIFARAGFNWQFWNYGSLGFGSNFSLEYLTSKDTDNFYVKNGVGAQGSLYFENFNRESKVRASIFLDFARQKTTISNQSNREIGLGITYIMPFGDNPLFL